MAGKVPISVQGLRDDVSHNTAKDRCQKNKQLLHLRRRGEGTLNCVVSLRADISLIKVDRDL